MGLGTIVHEEIQNALRYNNNIYNNISHVKEKKEISTYKKKSFGDIKFIIEGEVTIPSFKVRGFFDVFLQDFSASATEPLNRLIDIKTIGTFAWSKRFSKTKPVES